MKKFVEGDPSGPTNVVGRSFVTIVVPKATGEPKDKVHTLEMGDESHPSKSLNTVGTMGISRRHPFTDSTIGTPLPDKGKGFNRDCYDGTTDPNEHMDAFPTSMKRGALSWFTKLPPNFIDCFKTLVVKFDTQFATSRPHHLTSITLVSIRQEKGESLRKFINRFGKVAMSIRNLNPDVAIHHMLATLRPSPFADSLCMQPSR